MHEFALILTFQVIEIWFFAAMVLQGSVYARSGAVQSARANALCAQVVGARGLAAVPLILITKVLRNRRLGNTIMWFSLFIGQPLLE